MLQKSLLEDLKRLHSLNANPTVKKFLKNIGLQYLSMTTSEPTNQNHIQHQLFAVDFRVKTSQSRAEAKASRRIQGLVSSTNSSESYAWYDQDSSSWKTSQRSLITGWTSFSESFTRQGYMNANGHVFQRQWLEPVTKETGGGQLPTPRAQEPGRTNIGYGDSLKEGVCKQIGIPTSKYPTLLPTPNTMDHLPQRSPEALKRQMEGPRKGRTKLANLREAVNPETQRLFNSMLPTPAVCYDSIYYDNSPNKDKRHNKGLATHMVDQLSTPREPEWKEQGYPSGVMNETCSPQTGEATHLNPSFVEEMMAYPVGWSDLGH